MITRLAHVCLNVQDLQRSIAYYTSLGFKPCFDFTRKGKPFGIYLEIAPNQYLEMFEDPCMGKPVNTGLAHFCLESEDLDALMQDLVKRGIPFTPRKLGCDHTYQIWLEDPDGNKFEIHQYTAKSLQTKGGSVEADW
jgi:catechol 2,3-dioxygenase-like lactoylglutathione lyase family enzyme